MVTGLEQPEDPGLIWSFLLSVPQASLRIWWELGIQRSAVSGSELVEG